MDYHTLPRRQLQALCKKHGIPANAANSDMADALTALLKPKPQLPADNSTKQPAKRATRGREPAMAETVSKSKNVEKESNTKAQEPTNSRKILEEESNRKPQRVTRGRDTACAVLEAPRSAAVTEKMPTNGETESISATKPQEAKRVSTRKGASKQTNSEMPTNAEENVDSKAVSPKSDKKKEKAGGIVLRRGRVKVRSPGNLSKSPDSEKTKAVTTEVGVPSSQSCLVDAKKTMKKKRSVTFSDVLEIKSVCVEHTPRGDKEPAKETMPEIPQGCDPNLPKSANSASIAKKVVGTRRASRNASTKDCVEDVIAAQADHQKSSKDLVAKGSKAEGLHAFDAEKTANIEVAGQSNRKKSVRGKKILNSVGEAAAKENEEKVTDDFFKGDHIEDVPCTRRSRRLTIVPTDVKFNQGMQLATEQLKGQSEDQHEGSSIAVKKTEGALPAETSRKSRRKTLAPLELNHVQSNVGSASEQMEKRVSKAKVTQSKGHASELKDEGLESQQKHSEIKKCDDTPVASQAEVQPNKKKEAPSVRNVRGSRQKALVATKEVSNEMGYENICSTEIITAEVVKNVDTIESEKANSQAPLSIHILANSEPHSLQEVPNDAKVEVETAKTTSVLPRSTRKTLKVSTHPDNGTAISQEPAFNTMSNIVKEEGLVFEDKAVGKNVQESEDLDVVAQACIEKSQENLVVKNTNEPMVEDPGNNILSNEDVNGSNDFSSAFEKVTGKGEGLNQINSEDANSVSCNEEFEYNTCATPTHHATCDSETADSSSRVNKSDAADVKCHEFREETSSATSPECVQQGHEFTIEKDVDVVEQEGHAMDELATTSLTEDINEISSNNDSPVSIMIRNNGNLDGNHHMKCNDFDNSTDIHTDEGITASSPGAVVESKIEHQNSIDKRICTDEVNTASSPVAIVESACEHQNSIDIATAGQESCTPKVHLLTSGKDEIANIMSGGAADLVEQQPNQAVNLNLCGEDAIAKEDLQDTNEGVPSDGVKSVEDISTTDDPLGQLSPLLPSCSAEPGVATPWESACKTKQRHPRSIFKSARKVKSSAPWEDRSLEQNTAPPPNKEDSLDSLDQGKKDAEIWGLDSHEMSCDEVYSASSEEEESSAETEETLSDTEVCNFSTEVLISNTEGDYSSGEDDTPSDIEEDTMSDSEDDFSEMEGELLSGEEECYESEELDTSEEELSESEDDVEDDFEEYEVSPVSQSVANSESFNALCMTHGLEDQRVVTIAPSNSESFDAIRTLHGLEDQQELTIAPSKSSLANDGITQPEMIDHLDLANITNGCAPDVDPTDNEEKIGGQHEELQKMLITDAVSEIQENVDVQMSYNDNTAMERAQSTTDSTCEDGESLTSLSSLFATPASKVKDDVECSLAPPSIGILESNVSQQSGSLETELNILPGSGQEESIQFCLPCELSHEDVIAEVEQHTMDGAKHVTELCESVGGVEKELEINGQMVDLVETCFVENSLAGPAEVDCFMLSPLLDNVQNSQLLESNSKKALISGNEDEQIHISALELPCLGPCELIPEGNGAEMGDPEIFEEGIQNLNSSPKADVLEVQEEPGNLKIIQDGIEEAKASNVDVKNDLENNEVSVDMALDAQNDFSEVLDLREGTNRELEINGQMVELVETCSVENSLAGLAEVDCFVSSPLLDNVQNSQLLESNSKNASISGNENEISASELPCLGPCELILEGNGAKMGDPEICEEGIHSSPKADVLEVQEEPGNSKIIQDGIEEDIAGNVEVKNDRENNEVSVDMALDAQNDFSEVLDLREGTNSELREELMMTAVSSTTLAVNHNSNESEAAAEDLHILHLDSSISNVSVVDQLQEQNNEDALAFDRAYNAIGTTDSVVSLEPAMELELEMVSADYKTNLFSTDTSCEQDLKPSDASEQPKTEAIGEELEVIHSESNVERVVSQVMASNTTEVYCWSTPKFSNSAIACVFDHESLDEVAQTLHCVDIESVIAQVEEIHEKPLYESQSSEESNEDKEAAAEHNLITKEQSIKQIDLTLLSVRKLREMCKGTQMSSKKKTENATPARKPWMSATKQVHQPNTSMHPRDLPSGNKRSALQALSSNVKAASSAAMQTPTAKVLQRPRNLMGTLDGNEGTSKHLVTPSPQAPMSSKRDFARSHHR